MTLHRFFSFGLLAALTGLLLALPPAHAQGTISTLAGSNTAGFAGDGGPAARALFNSPTALAVDRAGNIFVADKGNARIRRIDAATGIVSTIAGDGQVDFSDNGGQAVGSQINNFVPAMVTDAAGNLYFADTNNHRIRRITPAGRISTVAGSGATGLLGGAFAGDGGPATSARLFGPRGLGIDERGNLLIADTVNQRIRRVDAATGIITTVAGTGQQGFSGDDGSPLSARFRSPTALSVDVLGRVHVVDEGNARVRRIVLGDSIRTVMGAGSTTHSGDGGAATSAGMQPLDVATDGAGAMFMADQVNGRVRRAVTDGRINTVAGSGTPSGNVNTGDGGLATSATMSPTAVAVDRSGGLLIASGNAIRRAAGVTVPPVAGFSLPDGGSLGAPSTPTQAFGVSSSYNVSTTVNVAAVPSGQRLQVFVVALVPGALLNVQPLVVPYLYNAQRQWGPAANPLQAFASNVNAATAQQTVVVDLLANFDITLLVGTEFYIGYGTDADEMLRAGRYRGVFKVLPL